MQVKADLTFAYKDKKTAEKISKAITIDDETFVNTQIKNNLLLAEIKSNSIPSFLQTINDYLSCLSVAENIMDEKKKLGMKS